MKEKVGGIKIRLNTFETNSSSAHTFVIRDNEAWTTDAEIEEFITSVKINSEAEIPDGYIPNISFVSDDDFGRGYRVLSEWYEKMSYLIAAYKYQETEFNTILEVLNERIPGTKGIIVKESDYYFSDEDEEEVSSTPLYDNEYEDFDCLGSIDHQSYDVADHALAAIRKNEFYKDKSLKEIFHHIIFCNKFVIITDSDETDTFMNLYEQGFFEDTDFRFVLYDNYNYNAEKDEDKYDPIFMEFNEYMHRYDNENEEEDYDL